MLEKPGEMCPSSACSVAIMLAHGLRDASLLVVGMVTPSSADVFFKSVHFSYSARCAISTYGKNCDTSEDGRTPFELLALHTQSVHDMRSAQSTKCRAIQARTGTNDVS